jgi:hypothetical protein
MMSLILQEFVPENEQYSICQPLRLVYHTFFRLVYQKKLFFPGWLLNFNGYLNLNVALSLYCYVFRLIDD